VSTRDRTVIAVLALVALIAGSWLLVIQPKRSELSSLKHQVSTEQSQLASAQAQVSQGQAARAQFGSNYTAMVKLGEAVPTDDNVGSLIYQIQAAATATGVDFRALTLNSQGGSSSGQNQLPPGVTVGTAGFPIEPFSFTFRGSFFHLSDFFARLQRFVTASQQALQVRGRLLTIDSINLGPGGGGFPNIDATVSATAYLLPSSQGLVAGATPLGPSSGVQSGATPIPGSSAPAGSTAANAGPAPASHPSVGGYPAPGATGGAAGAPPAAVVGGQP
jgi:Tfp pilus assembly protein PilO